MVTDPLTGAYNRRFLFGRMSVAADECVREGRFISVATFDLDHFKMLNDEHGHSAGDSVLCHFVSVLNGAGPGHQPTGLVFAIFSVCR